MKKINGKYWNNYKAKKKSYFKIHFFYKNTNSINILNQKMSANKAKETLAISFKSICRNVLCNSLAQAFLRLFHTSHIFIKIFLLAFLLTNVCLASYMVIKSILLYLSFQVTTTTRKYFEIPITFPKVIICNQNMFTTQFALDFIKVGHFLMRLNCFPLPKYFGSHEVTLNKIEEK